jgi:hypothetical protein
MKEYRLTPEEKAFMIELREHLNSAQQSLERAQAEEARLRHTLDGGFKMLLRAHRISTGALSADSSVITNLDFAPTDDADFLKHAGITLTD